MTTHGMPSHSTATSPSRRSWSVTLDGRRRPTLPPGLLEDAGIDPQEPLLAHVIDEGRIIFETRAAVRRRARERFAAGRAALQRKDNAAEDLLRDRENDSSLNS